jgi:D-glycero-D-manno-heptose 1,7-bisphosphate phosphatase
VKTRKRHRAVFLDRDGTICEEVGYLDSIERMRLIPRAGEAVRRINARGFKTIVVTNQSGVARGYFTEDCLQTLHEELVRQLKAEGAHLDGIYYCPHHPEGDASPYRTICDCRKPAPGLLLKAADELDVDLQASYMIGDHYSDVECAHRVGAKGVLLLTGHGQAAWAQRDQWRVAPDWIAEDLWAAVEWVLDQDGR